MKRASYDKGWGNIFVAILMVVYGFLHEPLLMILGALILLTAILAAIIESKARKYEEIEFKKKWPELTESERKHSPAV